jgi:hypothetical protein
MNLHDWIDELCDVLDIEVDVDEALVLDLARDAAHNVARPAAPITTFLLGFAAAGVAGNAEKIERLAGLASDLALRWDKPAGAVEAEAEDVEVDEDLATLVDLAVETDDTDEVDEEPDLEPGRKPA